LIDAVVLFKACKMKHQVHITPERWQKRLSCPSNIPDLCNTQIKKDPKRDLSSDRIDHALPGPFVSLKRVLLVQLEASIN